jgi:hypothetical protein
METNYADLRAVAAANEKIVDLFRWLDSQPDVVKATRGMDIRVYSDATTVEQFVEGGLKQGFGICYWLETRLQNSACTVAADVLVQTPDGQLTLRDASIDVPQPSNLASALLGLSEDLWRMRQQDLESVIQMAVGGRAALARFASPSAGRRRRGNNDGAAR